MPKTSGAEDGPKSPDVADTEQRRKPASARAAPLLEKREDRPVTDSRAPRLEPWATRRVARRPTHDLVTFDPRGGSRGLSRLRVRRSAGEGM